jgi:hypothetical protein
MNDQVVPRKIERNIEPSSLAEALAARGVSDVLKRWPEDGSSPPRAVESP